VAFRLDASPFAATQAVFENWFRMALYEPGVLAAGVDAASMIQREAIVYGSTGAGIQTFTYGPFELKGTVERIRVACAESGVVGTPGTCGVAAVFA
jgi:hypothetical protein